LRGFSIEVLHLCGSDSSETIQHVEMPINWHAIAIAIAIAFQWQTQEEKVT
jgi:hypothetical protein